MLQKRPTRKKARNHPIVRTLAEVAAGVHAAHGMAHGVSPSPDSAARTAHTKR